MKAIATGKPGEIDRKIAELTGLRAMRGRPVETSHGDARPDGPIIDGLAGKACAPQASGDRTADGRARVPRPEASCRPAYRASAMAGDSDATSTAASTPLSTSRRRPSTGSGARAAA